MANTLAWVVDKTLRMIASETNISLEELLMRVNIHDPKQVKNLQSDIEAKILELCEHSVPAIRSKAEAYINQCLNTNMIPKKEDIDLICVMILELQKERDSQDEMDISKISAKDRNDASALKMNVVLPLPTIIEDVLDDLAAFDNVTVDNFLRNIDLQNQNQVDALRRSLKEKIMNMEATGYTKELLKQYLANCRMQRPVIKPSDDTMKKIFARVRDLQAQNYDVDGEVTIS